MGNDGATGIFPEFSDVIYSSIKLKTSVFVSIIVTFPSVLHSAVEGDLTTKNP